MKANTMTDELADELLTLIEARQAGSLARKSEGDEVGPSLRRVAHANTAIADFIGQKWPEIITALRARGQSHV